MRPLALAERLGVAAAAKELGPHVSKVYGSRVKAHAERDQSETERNQGAEIARLKRKVAEQAEERTNWMPNWQRCYSTDCDP